MEVGMRMIMMTMMIMIRMRCEWRWLEDINENREDENKDDNRI